MPFIVCIRNDTSVFPVGYPPPSDGFARIRHDGVGQSWRAFLYAVFDEHGHDIEPRGVVVCGRIQKYVVL